MSRARMRLPHDNAACRETMRSSGRSSMGSVGSTGSVLPFLSTGSTSGEATSDTGTASSTVRTRVDGSSRSTVAAATMGWDRRRAAIRAVLSHTEVVESTPAAARTPSRVR